MTIQNFSNVNVNYVVFFVKIIVYLLFTLEEPRGRGGRSSLYFDGNILTLKKLDPLSVIIQLTLEVILNLACLSATALASTLYVLDPYTHRTPRHTLRRIISFEFLPSPCQWAVIPRKLLRWDVHQSRMNIHPLSELWLWELVPLPPDRTEIKCKWVFDIKPGYEGVNERYEAHLVALGCSQLPWRLRPDICPSG